MRKYFFLFCFAIFFVAARAQQFNADSLMHIAETTNNDSISITAFHLIFNKYAQDNSDAIRLYGKEAVAYGQAHNKPHLEAFGYVALSATFFDVGSLIQMQDCALKANKILEKYPNNILWGEVMSAMSWYQPTDSLRSVYQEKGVRYLETASVHDWNVAAVLSMLYGNISQNFLLRNNLDSSLIYGQKSFNETIRGDTSKEDAGYANAVLSGAYLQLHQYNLALAHARTALAYAQQSNGLIVIQDAYLTMAQYFYTTNQHDSAFYYYSKIYAEPNNGNYSNKVGAAAFLHQYYEQKHEPDSALKYADVYIIGNDSLNNISKTQEIDKINLQENLRQQQLAAQEAKQKETRKHNIQFAIIAIGILLCALFFLLMSRSFMVSHKTIEMLGVIMLLIVFEFINLLLHDYLSDITNNSPFLMLLALVIIAALIVPLHHRLEKWATKLLVEKNKEIRLAKAKKIVEQLEDK
ncbi:hypothetical protein [Arachidicoccus sp.]|uniref:hypothetical protein n=1 Tax=Arachidicoccus sp. TaxID=1872624 RepID=UPI003D1A44B4